MKFGDRVKDSLTGFTGIYVGRTDWMYGCSRIAIQPETLKKEGGTPETEWFDDQRVALVKSLPIKVSASSRSTSGGPKNEETMGRH